MNVYVYGQLVGDKRVKKIGKNGLFNTTAETRCPHGGGGGG